MRHYKEYDGYIIRSCQIEDFDNLRLFFRDHWANDHINFVDKEFCHWLFYNRKHNDYNFLIACCNVTGDILGQVGFIPSYIFDYDMNDKDKFIWIPSWRVRDGLDGGLGIKLLMGVFAVEGTKNTGTSGVYDAVVPMYKALRFETGVLNHYYVLNDTMKKFQIAVIPPDYTTDTVGTGRACSVEVIDQEGFERVFSNVMDKDDSDLPKKSLNFFINRYYNHPIYEYESLLVNGEKGECAIFIFRIVEQNGASAIRIMDGFGNFNEIGNIYNSLQSLLAQRDAEYIDAYCKGIDAEIMKNAGFSQINDDVIIPNFFEPFEQKNRHINYAYYNEKGSKYRIFKGDGDQDRPNIYHPKRKVETT